MGGIFNFFPVTFIICSLTLRVYLSVLPDVSMCGLTGYVLPGYSCLPSALEYDQALSYQKLRLLNCLQSFLMELLGDIFCIFSLNFSCLPSSLIFHLYPCYLLSNFFRSIFQFKIHTHKNFNLLFILLFELFSYPFIRYLSHCQTFCSFLSKSSHLFFLLVLSYLLFKSFCLCLQSYFCYLLFQPILPVEDCFYASFVLWVCELRLSEVYLQESGQS